MSQSHNLQTSDISVDDISSSINSVNLSESSASDSYRNNLLRSRTTGEPRPQDPSSSSSSSSSISHNVIHQASDPLVCYPTSTLIQNLSASSGKQIGILNIGESNVASGSSSTRTTGRVEQHGKESRPSSTPTVVDCEGGSLESAVDDVAAYADLGNWASYRDEATQFLKDLECSFQHLTADLLERAPTPTDEVSSVVGPESSGGSGTAQGKGKGKARQIEECDLPSAVPMSRPLSDYASPLSPSPHPSHTFRSNLNPFPNFEQEGNREFGLSSIAHGEDYVVLRDVEMDDGTMRNGPQWDGRPSKTQSEDMMVEDKPELTYQDVRMRKEEGHGQHTWSQHLTFAINPPTHLATRLPPPPPPSPPPPPHTRLYPPFTSSNMDDSPMDDDTQVTQPQPFIFQSFQPTTTNAFGGWGQATPQVQSQVQPVATPFSFIPQPPPVAPLPHPQYADPNEAAAYNFWFTMLAKIREQESQYQQQHQPMTTLQPQFSQPPRPFTPMFDLPSQPDGRPMVQRFSDDPPSPRFGGLRSRRSRRVEDRGFDPFHIGCGMRPLAPSSAIEGDIRVRGSEANLIHRLALEKRLEEESKQRAAKERQAAEQAALLVKDHEKKRKVKKRRRNSSSRRSTGDSPRKSKTEHRSNVEKPSSETPTTESPTLPSTPTLTSISRHEATQDTRRIKRQTFCPTFSMAIQRFLRAC